MILLLFSLILSVSWVYGQDPEGMTTPAQVPDSTSTSFWQDHNVNFAGIPMINYDPSFEWNLAALANVFFRVAPKDTISPLSMAGAILGYTTNGTWYWALYTKMYLDEDNYRITAGYGDASVNFQYYEEVMQEFINFTSLNDLFMLEVQRRVYLRWYLGLRYVYRQVKTSYDIPGVEPEIKDISNVSALISHDSRDFVYNPYHGDYMNFRYKNFDEKWGAERNFQQYEFDFTKFFPISDTKVIAGRVAAFVAIGDVPFEGQYVVGRDDIRGYTDGKHRANQVYNIQGEYRWNFYKKWGMVAFGGLATAVNDLNEFEFDKLLPGVGTGIRYMMVPSGKINVGIDVAVGRDDWGLYFRIGEVFGDK